MMRQMSTLRIFRSNGPDEPPAYNALFPDCEKGLKVIFRVVFFTFSDFSFFMLFLVAHYSIYLALYFDKLSY